MKKHLKIMIPIGVILIAVLCCTVFAVRQAFRTPIGFVDGIYYDMSPSDVKGILGEPQNITDHLEVCCETDYTYTVEIDGIATELNFTFLNDQQLYAVHAKAIVDRPADAEATFATWKEKIYTTYNSWQGFYCDEIQQNSDTDYTLNLGTHTGATGVSCTLSAKGNTVSLSCVNMT